MRSLASWLLILGTCLLPFVAAWPLLHPVNGQAWSPGIEEWNARMLWTVLYLVTGALIARVSWGLGLAVALGAGEVLTMPPHIMARTTGGLLMLGGLGVALAASWPSVVKARAAVALGLAGVLEALVMLLQAFRINPLWSGWMLAPENTTPGTFGNRAFCSTFVAMTSLFLPWPALIPIGGLLLYVGNKTAILAFLLGCSIRFSPSPTWTVASMTAVAIVFTLGCVFSLSGAARTWIWTHATVQWLREVPWLGYGLGLAPAIHTPTGIGAAYDEFAWYHVHNEPLQFLRERGLVALPALTGIGVSLRTMLQSRYAGPVAALVMIAFAQPMLHVVPFAAAAVLVCGLALSPTSDPIGA